MTTYQIYQIGYVAMLSILLITDWYVSREGKL